VVHQQQQQYGEQQQKPPQVHNMVPSFCITDIEMPAHDAREAGFDNGRAASVLKNHRTTACAVFDLL
jgi:hypothetical protein